VIQMLSPTDVETLLQRLGRGGRLATILCWAVLMAQNSMFDDSKEGQKRLLKATKIEETAAPAPKEGKRAAAVALRKAKVADETKARRTPKEYTEAIYHFINAPGCRVDILDKEFDNPPRLGESPCECDFHRKERGELTFRDMMKQE
jgi:hypothetical protein